MGTVELAVVGIAGSGIGAALSVPMVWRRRPDEIRLMGGWLLAVSALTAIISARVVGLVPDVAAADHAINLLGLLTYPLLYLYLHHQTRGALPARRAWLWAPAALYVGALVVRSGLGWETRVPFVWLLPVLLCFTAACAVLVFRSPGSGRAGIVPPVWLVGFLIALNIAQIVRMLFGHVAPVPALVPFVITLAFVALVAVVAWRLLESRPLRGAAAARYERSGLDRDAALELVARIDRALTGERLFADAELTLARLAAAVASTPHQVSEVLNRYANTTFAELVNRHRVEFVKAQLRDPDADRFTIEGIGASAGFGSRSALYAAFRKLEGVTPTEYRRSAR